MKKKLEFDIDTMTSFKGQVGTLLEALETERTGLKEYLEKLKKEWYTNAGKKFFEEDFSGWEEHVDLYIKLLTTLDDMIDTAIEEYSEVRERAGGSAISC